MNSWTTWHLSLEWYRYQETTCPPLFQTVDKMFRIPEHKIQFVAKCRIDQLFAPLKELWTSCLFLLWNRFVIFQLGSKDALRQIALQLATITPGRIWSNIQQGDEASALLPQAIHWKNTRNWRKNADSIFVHCYYKRKCMLLNVH